MSLDILILIMSITISIIDIILVIIYYKYFSFCNYTRTIETLVKSEWESLIVSLVPIINIILLLMLGGQMIWEKIKNIKL